MSCALCKHVCIDGYEPPHGVCRRFPPTALETTASTFPLVHLDKFHCGEFVAKPKEKASVRNKAQR